MSSFLKPLEVAVINLAASQIEAHEADIQALIGAEVPSAVDAVIKLVEKDDASVPAFIRLFVNSILNEYEPQIQALLPTVAGSGVPQLVAALKALAVKVAA